MKSAPIWLHCADCPKFTSWSEKETRHKRTRLRFYTGETSFAGCGGRALLHVVRVPTSGMKSLVLADPMLQCGCQLVHVRGRKVHYVRFKHRDAGGYNRIPAHLDK